MSYAAHQRAFAEWLVDDCEARPPVAGIDPARIGVHRNTFLGTLVQALAESFPVTRSLSGAEFFDAMARARVLRDPPRSPVLSDYAVTFPGYVVGFEPAQSTPVLAEMAQLEAMRLRAFHATDADPIGLARFHPLACDARRLERTAVRLHPAANWLPARHPVLDIWHRHDGAADGDVVDLGDLDPDRAQHVLVHRPGLVLRMRLLPPGAVIFLDALAAGCPLASAFSEAARLATEVEPATLLSLLLQDGLVTELIELAQESK